VFFVVVPVVSLVPRSTTGYKLASLRDEEHITDQQSTINNPLRIASGLALFRRFDHRGDSGTPDGIRAGV
jgi:hypothetical protein